MGGAGFSRVNENAREEVLSSDLNRGLNLLSRDVQDALAYMSSDLDSNAPFSGAVLLPPITGDISGYTATAGAGKGFAWDPTFPGLTSDDSANLVLRWASSPLTFANPDSTNPRIDLIVGTPNYTDIDTQARNILLNPNTRAFAPQNVNKTSNPVTTLTVVTGTPSGSPVAPAVPAHGVALYEVYVPAAVANASLFFFWPRLWRKCLYPMSALNAIVSDCKLVWDTTVDPSAASAGISFNAYATHAFIIDGEMITFKGSPKVVQDTGANPFGTSAPATAGRPYYVYLCAGRNQPQGALGTVGTTFPFSVTAPLPAVLVESTVPPDPSGRPSAAIITPRGSTTRGALYVGLGFVYRGTTNRQNLIQSNGVTWAARGILEVLASATSPTTFLSVPAATSRGDLMAKLRVILATTGAQTNATIAINTLVAGAPATMADGTIIEGVTGASATLGFARTVDMPLGAGSPGVAWLTQNASTVSLDVLGYSNGVHRLAG